MVHFTRKSIRQSCTAMALVLFISGAGGGGVHAEDPTCNFNIPAENAAQALTDFSRQTGIQILYPYDLAASHTTPAIIGKFTREDVLARILKDTGLEVVVRTDTSITLRAIGSGESPTSKTTDSATEVIVTGTHIRGGNPTSPVHVIDQKEIERSGYADIGDVVRSLPENFSGGQNPGVFFANSANTDNSNLTNASTFNLRGLGTDATLTLLNGHRMAADGYFQASDISGVPLGAVQRIEVVPDGASALYGSDAVAGVANIILRKNYTGTELSARYGAATQGGGADTSISALTGSATDNHYWLASLEVEHQEPVRAGQRDFTAEADPSTTLVQDQKRHSLFLAGGLTLSDQTELTSDLLVSDRETAGQIYQYATYYNSGYTPNYNASIGLTQHLSSTWKLHVTGVAAGSRNSLLTELPDYGYASTGHYDNSLSYLEAVSDGTLLTLPSGDVKTALGAGYRTEKYRSWVSDGSAVYGGDRNVSYVFGEALIPLVSRDANRGGLNELELSLSARSEHYSDFGNTTNPRIGVRYVPGSGLTIRGTWGKSFKAPSFDKMYQPNYVGLYKASARGYSGGGTALYVGGGNPDLRPEKSTSWTLGADYVPPSQPTLRLSATYFDIDYTDRVVTPVNSFATGLSDPIFAPFVDWNPSGEEQAALLASASEFYNFSGGAYDPTTVVAVIRNQYTNAASQRAKGVDVAYSQSFGIGAGILNTFANATWLRLDQQTISTVPEVKLSGTIFNAPELKARAGVTYTHGGWAATSIVNYLSDETDTGVTPTVEIGSWTTVDANVAYRFHPDSSREGLKLSLSVSNLLDRDPPRAVSSALAYPGMAFDSTNTSIMGRYVSLAVSQAW